MEALRYPKYRLALGISTLAWIALWLSNIAVTAGMLQAGRTSADIGLFQGAWTLGVPLSVIAGGLITDRLGPTTAIRLGLCLEFAGMVLMGLAVSVADVPLPGLLLAAMLIGSSDGMNGVGINVLAGGVVPRHLMASAIGLLLLALASGRIVGGTLAGPAVQALGASGALYLCAALVAMGLVLTFAIGHVQLAPTDGSRAYADLRPAMRWYRQTPDARTVLTVGALMAVLVYGYFSLLPVIVGQTMGTDTTSQGLAMAAGGFGVAVAALLMGPTARRIGVGRLLFLAALGASASLVTLGLGQTSLVVLIAVTFLPAFTNVQAASASVVLQTLAPVGVRGRVVGLYSMTFAALLPVGTVTAGWLGARFGARETLLVLASLMAISVIVLAIRRPAIARELVTPVTAVPGPQDPLGVPATAAAGPAAAAGAPLVDGPPAAAP